MNMNYSKEHLKYKLCVVCNVPQSEAPSVMYAKFPKNINRCRKWIRVIGDVKLLQLSQKKIQYRYVCGNHFKNSYFTKSGKHLTKDAVPTILPPNIKPLTKDVVKLFPPLVTRTNNKVLLKCTQRIVPIKKEVIETVEQEERVVREIVSPDSTAYDYEYLDKEYIESLEDEECTEQRITIRQALDPTIEDCLPKIIPILHHNLVPNSHMTEIYTINKDKQVVPITSKVLHDGKDCIIELSQKKMPTMTKKPKFIPVSNEVLSSIIKKDRSVKLDLVGYKCDAYQRIHETTHRKPILETTREAQLQKKIQKLQLRNRQLKRMLKNVGIVGEVESPYIKKLIKKTIFNKQLNFGINEFTNEHKLAISLLKRALNAYHYLSGIIPLPNVCMLEKISMNEPIYSKSTKCKHLL